MQQLQMKRMGEKNPQLLRNSVCTVQMQFSRGNGKQTVEENSVSICYLNKQKATYLQLVFGAQGGGAIADPSLLGETGKRGGVLLPSTEPVDSVCHGWCMAQMVLLLQGILHVAQIQTPYSCSNKSAPDLTSQFLAGYLV